MELAAVQAAYKRYSGVYDHVFGTLLAPGRQLTIDLINRNAEPHAKILEVGVGTGLSLLNYRKDLEITGIDVSREMLRNAQQRVQKYTDRPKCILLEMNAEKLAFSNGSFNCVVAMYVASAVPNLANLLNEIARVCMPGGDIIFINHFSSSTSLIKKVGRMIKPLETYLGFRLYFPVDPIINYPRFKLEEVYQTNMLGGWRLLHLKNDYLSL